MIPNIKPEKISGGPIWDAEIGWALIPMTTEFVHLWRQINAAVELPDGTRQYESACGLKRFTTRHVPALEAGTYSKCLKCQRVPKKRFMRNLSYMKSNAS